MVRISPIKRLEIVQAFSKVGSVRSVARKYGVHRKTVCHWLEVYHNTGQLEVVRVVAGERWSWGQTS